MANTSSKDEGAYQPDIGESPLADLWEAIKAVTPNPLPDNAVRLEMLQRSASDVIAYLTQLQNDLSSDSLVLHEFLDVAQKVGAHPFSYLPELPTSDPIVRGLIRWDVLAEYLVGEERFCLQLLRATIRKITDQWNSRQVALSSTAVVDGLAAELGMIRRDEEDRAEFRKTVALCYERCSTADDHETVAVGIELAIHAFKQLELRIIAKAEETEFLIAGWKRPSEWLPILEKFGEPMSHSTFKRRIDSGDIRTHPNSTPKRIAIHFNDLPIAYQKFLRRISQ